MNDAELSLAVAMIMWPDEDWHQDPVDCGAVCAKFFFTHTTDDALGKMCVWLAHHYWGNAVENGARLIFDYLLSDNPHRAIAEAIVEVGMRR